jgi:hypothetical protein
MWQMPDQTGLPQVSQRTEVLGDRGEALLAQVHHVEAIAAEWARWLS